MLNKQYKSIPNSNFIAFLKYLISIIKFYNIRKAVKLGCVIWRLMGDCQHVNRRTHVLREI